MRLYGGKFLKSKMARQVEARTETRNAKVFDVQTDVRRARVLIQGSSTYVIACYPEMWESTPYWLKSGAPVTIQHTGGNRGRIELVGPGALIPTPVSGDPGSESYTLPDAVVSGLAITPGGGMVVDIAAGTIRISGTTYTVSATTKTVSTAPSVGQFRYDILAVGADSTVDYTAGTASGTPAMPATPSGHILIGWILVPGGVTVIDGHHINTTYTAPYANSMSMTITDGDLAWAETSTAVTVYIYDQYGNAYSASGTMTLECEIGNGTISDSGSKSFSGSSVAWTYTRGGNDPGDESPMLKATFGSLTAFGMIILRNASGNPM